MFLLPFDHTKNLKNFTQWVVVAVRPSVAKAMVWLGTLGLAPVLGWSELRALEKIIERFVLTIGREIGSQTSNGRRYGQ